MDRENRQNDCEKRYTYLRITTRFNRLINFDQNRADLRSILRIIDTGKCVLIKCECDRAQLIYRLLI